MLGLSASCSLFYGCLKTDVLNAPIEQIDSVVVLKSQKGFAPQIEEDTTRVKMDFNPSVVDWEEAEDNDISI